jgi:hypothetical protein
MDTFPILFAPQDLAFYQLTFPRFEAMFNSTKWPKEDLLRVFTYLT